MQTSVQYEKNTIVIQLPIGGKLNNGVSLTDCFQIKLYTSNKTNTILLNANDYSSFLTSSGPESVCFGCSIARMFLLDVLVICFYWSIFTLFCLFNLPAKRPVTTFASFVYKNLPWTDDYNNLSSVKSLELANRISNLVSGPIEFLFCFFFGNF